jgi:hypothetical protein
MEHRYYSCHSLASALEVLEERFGMNSGAFYDLYVRDAVPAEMPRFLASFWVSLWGPSVC